MKITGSLLFLSLFTSRQQALEIEGDLLEQQGSKGRLWLAWQVFHACLYLAFQQLRMDAGKLLLVSYAIYELILKLNWMVLREMRAFLYQEVFAETWDMSVSFTLVNIVIAFAIGMLMLRVSAQKGFIVLLLVSAMMLGRTAILVNIDYTLEIAAFALVPGIIGAFLMQMMQLGSSEQQLLKG